MPARFPDGFLWGAATAAFQIEGAAQEDGRGQSIWDTFCRQPGKVRNGDTGDVACDHYHRFRDDIALMKSLGLQAYRFSIAWPRIYAFGAGPVNEPGLRFYDQLVDALLDAGIEPMATLYHWDLPQALQDRGGWANRETAYHFATYARTMYERLGGRVKKWVTLNEPIVVADYSHLRGWLAPGIRDHAINARVTHHLMLAHGLAVQAFREMGTPGLIGITNANTAYEAIDGSPAALRAQDLARDFNSRVFHGPVYGRGYPASALKYYAERGAPFPIEDGDMAIIATPTDFLGVNNYSRAVVEPDDGPMGFRRARPALPLQPMGYEEAPHSLGDFVRWVSKEYDNPVIYVTENGSGDVDGPAEELVNDQRRVHLLRGFLEGLAAAIAEGADVRGYYVWSLMDNFEWAFGYGMRFGICYTNYETLERKPKASARFYSAVIRGNGF
jgi:beta-glucosidase